MRKVNLDMKEQMKYEVIKKLVETKGNKNTAAIKLDCTRKTINRLIKVYIEKGKEGFVHGNRGRTPINKTPDEIINLVTDQYRLIFEGANFRHYSELLQELENIKISDSTLNTILRKANILSPKARKLTKKMHKKKLNELKNEATSLKAKGKIQVALDLLERVDAHPRRPRSAYFGELVQMDASEHIWFGDNKSQLHLAIDDATGMILGAFFDTQETLKGYYNVFYQILMGYGIPYKFLTDRRTVFEYKKKNAPSDQEDTFTQFSYACHQLGVEIATTSIPQAKGRIERLNQTLQSRLVTELKINNINTIEEANEFLKHYVQKFNERFALPINKTKTVFEERPSLETINTTLAVLVRRKVDNGHSVKFDNDYHIPTTALGKEVYHQRKTPALVIKAFDGNIYVSIQDQIYLLKKIEKRLAQSNNFDSVEKPKVSEKYIPPKSHPWRSGSYESFVIKQKHRQNDSVYV